MMDQPDFSTDTPTLESLAPSDLGHADTLPPPQEDHVESDSDDSCLLPFAALLTRPKTTGEIDGGNLGGRTNGDTLAGRKTPSHCGSEQLKLKT